MKILNSEFKGHQISGLDGEISSKIIVDSNDSVEETVNAYCEFVDLFANQNSLILTAVYYEYTVLRFNRVQRFRGLCNKIKSIDPSAIVVSDTIFAEDKEGQTMLLPFITDRKHLPTFLNKRNVFLCVCENEILSADIERPLKNIGDFKGWVLSNGGVIFELHDAGCEGCSMIALKSKCNPINIEVIS